MRPMLQPVIVLVLIHFISQVALVVYISQVALVLVHFISTGIIYVGICIIYVIYIQN